MPSENLIFRLLLSIGLLAAFTGCDLHSARNNNAHLRLEKAIAKTKVSVAEEFFQSGQIDQAEQVLNQSLEVSPQAPEAQLLMGKIYYVRDRLDKAREFFNAALKLDKDLQQARDFLELIARSQQEHVSNTGYVSEPVALKQ